MPCDEGSNSDKDTDYEQERVIRVDQAKGKHAHKTTEGDRRSELDDDKWVKDFEQHRVLCKGCNKWIKLSSKCKFDTKDWKTHRGICSPIVGYTTKRVWIRTNATAAPMSCLPRLMHNYN